MTQESETKPVFFTTPDGVKRELRFSCGAQKRIVDRFGMQLKEALDKYDAAALPEVLYCMMFDKNGKPPADLDPVELAESLSIEDSAGLLATLIEASCQGRVDHSTIEAMIVDGMKSASQTVQ